jgi:photosystem II stability/assembly factor-like uncharacterized protein
MPTISWTQRTKKNSGFSIGHAINADGSVIIEQPRNVGGSLYKSTNLGASWGDNFSPATYNLLNSGHIFTDDDASVIIAKFFDGGSNYKTFFSVNGGTNWTDANKDGGAGGVALDADGSVMLAVGSSRLYKSVDTGSNWTEMTPAGAGTKSWNCLCMDNDGSLMIAGISGGRLYKSTDTGANWSEIQPAGAANKSWGTAACSSDGTYIIVGEKTGRLYTSSNSGVNWTERQPAGANDIFWDVDCSDDGIMVASSRDSAGRTYISFDYGVTWEEMRPINDSNYQWSVRISADGTKMFAQNHGNSAYSYYGEIITASPSNFLQLL